MGGAGILTDFQPRYADLFGRHILNLGHRLHESPLFSDDALARLLEDAPRSSYHVHTMDPTTHDPRTRLASSSTRFSASSSEPRTRSVTAILGKLAR